MRHYNYLASKRLEHGLEQHELAELLGVTQSTVSRCETGEQHPTATFAIGCHILFGVEPPRLFPDLASEIGEAVIERAVLMEERLRFAQDRASQKKLRLIDGLPTRVTPKPV